MTIHYYEDCDEPVFDEDEWASEPWEVTCRACIKLINGEGRHL